MFRFGLKNSGGVPAAGVINRFGLYPSISFPVLCTSLDEGRRPVQNTTILGAFGAVVATWSLQRIDVVRFGNRLCADVERSE